MMKFNVDGATQGSPGEVEIVGALQDENGCMKISFSKAIGMGDANIAEV